MPLTREKYNCGPRPGIVVVIPAYRVAAQIAGVVARVPAGVRHILVVDDASPDDLTAVLATIADPRLIVLRHDANRGVGGAMKTGFIKALELNADIIVKVDGDGQMDPALIPQFVEPIVADDADFTKGNRFDDLSSIRRMPLVRRLGNLALSFLVKLASGYWHVFDPCNGYVAIRSRVVRRLNFDRLGDRYFFEISLLCEAYFAKAVLQDIPMQPVYAGETSSLSPMNSAGNFAPQLVQRSLYRVLMSYFMRDFNVVSVFLVGGVPFMTFGVAWSAYYWILSIRRNVLTSTGTVIIGMLAIVLGFPTAAAGDRARCRQRAEEAPLMTGRVRHGWVFPGACLLGVAVLVGAYSNSFQNAFHFDDGHVVETNPYIRSLANLPLFFRDANTATVLPANAQYRPLVTTTLALDYWLGGGLKVEQFHRSQLTMLVVLGVMLFFLFRKVLDLTEEHWWNRYVALLAAVLFCVHTTGTETMNLIHARSELLSAIGVVGSFLVYLYVPRSRRAHLYLLPDDRRRAREEPGGHVRASVRGLCVLLRAAPVAAGSVFVTSAAEGACGDLEEPARARGGGGRLRVG